MYWLGLTGGIACGKSTVSKLLKEKGVAILDADEIARDVVAPGMPGLKSIVQEFGPGFVDSDGYFDRAMMGEYVFGNAEKRHKLEAILHPLIRSSTQHRRKKMTEQGHKYAVYDIPLLFETKAQEQFDAVIVVSCSEEQQKRRLIVRQGLTEAQALQRLKAQIPLKEKIKGASFVLNNDKDLDFLKTEVDRLFAWIKSRFDS